MSSFDQNDFEVRFEWGSRGADEVGRGTRVIIVVDVLRFSTVVEAAVSRGASVYPYRWRDDTAVEFAKKIGAVLAVPREEATPDHSFSLSPLSMQTAVAGTKIVLPSPNGAEVSLAAAEHRAEVLAGCFRNASAVAKAALAIGPPIAVIAAGERWKIDGSLRPSFEDRVGAGAVLNGLQSLRLSPEASAADTVFQHSRHNLERLLLECSSGRELSRKGFADDVGWSAQLDASSAVPQLREGAFVAKT